MRHNTIDEADSTDDSSGFKLRELRRIITRHRRRHEQAERTFREWQRTWSVNEQVREEQLARIGNQLMDRLRSQAALSGPGGEAISN